jgi:hypothetical protein
MLPSQSGRRHPYFTPALLPETSNGELPAYSSRSDRIGATIVAQRAGPMVAASTAANRTTAAKAKLAASERSWMMVHEDIAADPAVACFPP